MEINDNQNSLTFNPERNVLTIQQSPFEEESTSDNDLEGLRNLQKPLFTSPFKPLNYLLDEIEVSESTIRSSSEKKIMELLGNNQQISIGKCREHKQELFFACYNCEKKTVCIECVSSGVHIGHDIKNLKKATQDIKSSLNQNLLLLQGKIENYAGELDRLQLKKSEVIELNIDMKYSIQTQFSLLKTAIRNKEREILMDFEEIVGKKQKQLDDLILRFRRKINIFIQSHKTIEQITRDLTDLQLCQYYHNKQNDLNNTFQDISNFYDQNLQKMVDKIQSFKCVLDPHSFQQIINNLNSVNLDIQQLKTFNEKPVEKKGPITDSQKKQVEEPTLIDKRITYMKLFIESKCNNQLRLQRKQQRSQHSSPVKLLVEQLWNINNENSNNTLSAQDAISIIRQPISRFNSGKKLDDLQQILAHPKPFYSCKNSPEFRTDHRIYTDHKKNRFF